MGHLISTKILYGHEPDIFRQRISTCLFKINKNGKSASKNNWPPAEARERAKSSAGKVFKSFAHSSIYRKILHHLQICVIMILIEIFLI